MVIPNTPFMEALNIPSNIENYFFSSIMSTLSKTMVCETMAFIVQYISNQKVINDH